MKWWAKRNIKKKVARELLCVLFCVWESIEIQIKPFTRSQSECNGLLSEFVMGLLGTHTHTHHKPL